MWAAEQSLKGALCAGRAAHRATAPERAHSSVDGVKCGSHTAGLGLGAKKPPKFFDRLKQRQRKRMGAADQRILSCMVVNASQTSVADWSKRLVCTTPTLFARGQCTNRGLNSLPAALASLGYDSCWQDRQ